MMASEQGSPDRDARRNTAALLEKIKQLKNNAKEGEERYASLAEASGGSGGSASVREAAASSSENNQACI